ncbi:hypothetical protein R3P38DRAFT_3003307 [Favolaschia claudopus]|uniref:F-box domain-containing protein n=1 Tax=Favolaschia claudopus TaxID=2862362 RepID=A0AAW0APN1_9AGAR
MSNSAQRPSFLQSLLQSNQPPLDWQIPAIRGAISATEARLAPLRVERDVFLQQLAALEKQMAAIQKERKKLKKKATALDMTMRVIEKEVQAQSAILSPIRRLPPEILCEVFQWAVLHRLTRKVTGSKIPVASWFITHICRSWREAARACARLWSSIEIRMPDHVDNYNSRTRFIANSDTVPDTDAEMNTETDTDTDISSYEDTADSDSGNDHPSHSLSIYFPKAALDAQLELSYPAPLQVVFNTGLFKKASHLCKLLAALVCHSNRWERLRLDWTYDAEIFSVLAKIQGQLASLRFLKIGLRGSDYWPSIFADIFSVAPRLRRVEATILGEIPAFQFLLPQHQLTHLRLCTSSRRALDILPLLADTLIDAALSVDEAEYSSDLEDDSEDELESESLPTVVELPKLQWLSLDNDSGMGGLIIPRLESLKLDSCIVNVHTILDRSSCHLKSLSFTGWAAPRVLRSLVKQAPTLGHLWVEFPLLEEGKSLLSALTQSVADGVCPKLVSLEVELSRFSTFQPGGPKKDLEIICDAVESCWDVEEDSRTLLSVRFPMSKCPLAILERFDRMRLEGLDVNEFSVNQDEEEF